MIPAQTPPKPASRRPALCRQLLAVLVAAGHAQALANPTETAPGCPAGESCKAEQTASHETAAPPAPSLTRAERRAQRKAEEEAQRQAANARLDWYPIDELSPAQRAATPVYCDGAYVEPKMRHSGEAYEHRRPGELRGSGSRGDEREMSSAGEGLLQANRLTFTQDNDTAYARGDIELRQHGVLLRGSAATINTADNTGVIENAEFLSHRSHTRGGAEQIRRESETITRLINGHYSRCAPTDDGWLLSAGEIELNQANGLATARDAVLRIGNVPVFYSPWITFPADNRRRSGLLFPMISTSTDAGGLDFAVPWYWNAAPNWDATFAGRYIGSRGVAAEVQARHLNSYSEWQTDGSYINDSEFGDRRWLFSLKERSPLNQAWSHGINYTKVSDDDYLADLSGATSLDFKRSTNLEQSAFIALRDAHYNIRADVVQYQIIDETVSEQHRRLPQLWFDYESDPIPFKPAWLVKSQLSHFEIDDRSQAAGTRLYLEPGVSLPLRKSWGYLTPTLKLRSVSYLLDDSHCLYRSGSDNTEQSCAPGSPQFVDDKTPSTMAPMASLDSGLFFEKPAEWFGKRYTHSLEPRLYYLYTEYEDQTDQPIFDTGPTTFNYNQLFRESRFTGYDRIADANQLSVGISSRLIQQATGTETLWASIGQIYYFSDLKVGQEVFQSRNTTRNRSPISAEAGYQWTRNLRSYASALYDHAIETYDNDTDSFDSKSGFSEAGLQLRYFGDTGLVLNIGYRYRINQTLVDIDGETSPVLIDDYIKQTDFSTIFPVTRHLAVVGTYNYDHTNARSLGTVAGFEYNACCWKTRIVFQNGLDTNGETERGLYLQFELKGLGAADTGVNSILKDTIVGYEDYEERDHY